MPRDYAKKGKPTSKKRGGKSKSGKRTSSKRAPQTRQKKSSSKKRQMPWRSVLLLIVILLIIAAVVYGFRGKLFHKTDSGAPVVDATPVQMNQPSIETENSTPSVAPKRAINYVFTKPVKQQQPVKQNAQVMLQLGSFKQGDDLTLLQDNLKKHGFHFRTITLDRAGETSYRIEMGPYDTAKAADKVQIKLRKQKIYSIQRSV